MKLFTLVTLLWNTNTIDVTGEWTLKYKTFGKKVEKELAIQVLQSGLLGRSSNSEFAMYMDDTLDEMYRLNSLFDRLHGDDQMGNEA